MAPGGRALAQLGERLTAAAARCPGCAVLARVAGPWSGGSRLGGKAQGVLPVMAQLADRFLHIG